MFNVVTNKRGRADAILIRPLEPVSGIEIMQDGWGDSSMRITSGPAINETLGMTEN